MIELSWCRYSQVAGQVHILSARGLAIRTPPYFDLESVHDFKVDLQAAANACSCPRSHEVARNAHKAPL